MSEKDLQDIPHESTESSGLAAPASADSYRQIFDKNNFAMLLIDPASGAIVDANQAACQFYGYPHAEFQTRNIKQINCLDETEIADAMQRATIGERSRFLFCHRLASGETRQVEVSSSPLTIKNRQLLCSTIYDITERALAQKKLQQNEELFRTLIENADDIITIFNRDFTIRYESPAVEKILGFKPSELRGRALAEMVHPADRPALFKMMRYKHEHPGEVVPLRARVRHKNGEYRTLVGSSVNLLDNPAVQGIIANSRDVTEQIEAETKLKRSEERYRTIFDKDLAANSISTPDARLLDCNEQFWRTFGFESKSHALGVDLNQLFGSKAKRDQIVDTIRRRRTVKSLEIQMRSLDGTPLDFVTNAVGIFDENTDELIEIHDHGFDITEQKSAEARLRESEEMLRQSQKLDAVGQLAGGVAHDFNNLLTAILGYSELLLMRLQHDPAAREKVAEIKRAGERAAALTRQLLAFNRKQVLQPTILNLNQSIQDVNSLLQRLIGEHISINLQLLETPALIQADSGQIELVIMNLAINARDAMPNGGSLLIETKFVEFGEADRHEVIPPGQYVVLAISDTGTGMTADVQSRAFEPFFTTKELGKGTGLGLSTVYGIVKQSGGYIRLYSELSVGTTFTIYLPRVAQQSEIAESATTKNSVAPGSETILLVEDEAAVRSLTAELLEASGYKVLTAANGYEALQISDEYNLEIDLLMTDVVMPGLSGRQLAEKLGARRPKTKVFFISGYTELQVAQLETPRESFAFLQKPFALNDLLGKIRDALDNRQS